MEIVYNEKCHTELLQAFHSKSFHPFYQELGVALGDCKVKSEGSN